MEENILKKEKINKLFLNIGIPMIISMVLQALYNVIDSIFVANIKDIGPLANEALTYAFPIQILIIAIGVGTGVGLNTLLSKNLGENNKNKVNEVAGNGIFLGIVIYLIFLIFGIFGSGKFIKLFSNDNQIISMGKNYLMICTVFSFGQIGFTIYERLLQATGKAKYSTIAQISGAVINIVFDYVFIFIFNLDVIGAAIATVLGQIVSLIISIYFHYHKNKEIDGNVKYIKFNKNIFKEIYKIGFTAMIMQGLLALMMAIINKILGLSNVSSNLLVGSFGIYYKIQQIALFSCFGLSNTMITILSFNYGLKDKKRINESIKYGILYTFIVTIIITVLFFIIAKPLSLLFSIGSNNEEELIIVCKKATRIGSLGFCFMGYTIIIQGIFQALKCSIKPLITALLRLIIFVIPIAYYFVLKENVLDIFWYTFPISEFLTAIISYFMLKYEINKKINIL